MNSSVLEPLGHDYVGHGVEQPDVGARLYLQMPISDIGEPDSSRVAHSEPCASLDGPFHLHRDDGMSLGGIGPGDKEKIGVSNLGDRVRHRAGSVRGHQTGDRGSVSSSCALMNVMCAERTPSHLLHQVVFFDRATTRADKSE